jgi:hypothetical protein
MQNNWMAVRGNAQWVVLLVLNDLQWVESMESTGYSGGERVSGCERIVRYIRSMTSLVVEPLDGGHNDKT